jgi:uncharacterized membrane protein YdjX (TVP38/TMEM64 family)
MPESGRQGELEVAAPIEPVDPTRSVSAGELVQRLGLAGVLGAAWSVLPAISGILLLTYLARVSKWLLDQGKAEAVCIYTGAFMLSAGLGLMPTYAQAALAGWCFGLALGFPAALAGFLGAAAVGYFVARTVARDRVESILKENAKAEAVRQALIGRGFLATFGVVTLIRLPSSPFAITNLAMASTGVPLGPYLLGTVVGMAPRTFLAVLLGSSAQQLTVAPPRWLMFASIAAAMVVVGIIGTIAKRALAKVTGNDEETPREDG